MNTLRKEKTAFQLQLLSVVIILSPMVTLAQKIDMFVGTYTDNNISEGIYRYAFDLERGDAQVISETTSSNASFLAKYEDRLLAVNENGEGKGQVSLFAITKDEVRLLDTISSFGDSPCHVSWSADGRLAFVSNYSGGSLQSYLLSADRESLKFNEGFSYQGSGPNPQRQKAPHIHSAFFDPNGHLYVSDLGSDQVYVYEMDRHVDTLILNNIINTIQGGGPRHVAFGTFPSLTAYVLLELTGQLTVYQARDDEWHLRQVLPVSDYEFTGEHGGADVKVSPDGRFVYATNRGNANVVVCYQVLDNGLLEVVQVQPTLGVGPRNFNITPDGRYLLVANQRSDEIVVFGRDVVTGMLTDIGKRIALPSPVCIIF